MNGYLGTGISFPFLPTNDGPLAYLGGPAKVEQAIIAILQTEPGERLMRPTFGCGLQRYIMQPNSVATRAMIRGDVEKALNDWEPRIQLTEVTVDPGDDPALVLIAIRYVHVRTRTPGNLVYPFYLQ
jgi:phage baseplate assembly protein W